MYQFSISDDGTLGNHWWNGLLDKKKCILYLYSSTTISSHDCLKDHNYNNLCVQI